MKNDDIEQATDEMLAQVRHSVFSLSLLRVETRLHC